MIMVFLYYDNTYDIVKIKLFMDLENQEIFSLAVSILPTVVVITDADGKILYVNKAVNQVTGYSQEEFLGKIVNVWVGTEKSEFYDSMWQAIKVERVPFRAMVTNKRKSGEQYKAEITISPIVNNSGNLLGFVGIETDVSEQYKLTKQLRYNEERFRALIEHSHDVVSLLSEEGKIIYQSPAVKAILGYEESELVGMSFLNLVHPEDAEMAVVFERKIMKSGEDVGKNQFRVQKKDGSFVWVEATGINLLNKESVNAIVVHYRDVTMRKLQEDELKKHAEFLAMEKIKDEALLQSIGDGVIVTDQAGVITLVNRALVELLGFREDELVGKPIMEALAAYDEKDQPIYSQDRLIMQAIKERKKVQKLHKYQKKDGSRIFVSVTITPVLIGQELQGTIQVVRDVTAEKEADDFKVEFLTLASHQLRTPLSAIHWYCDMLLSPEVGDLNEKQRQYILTIAASNRRMIELANAFLDATRLETGRVRVVPKPTKLPQLIEEVFKQLEIYLQEKRQKFKLILEDELPVLPLDGELVCNIMLNLLTNAIKYSPEKSEIEVRVRHREGSVIVEVRDKGVGIPKVDQSKVFQKFFRSQNILKKVTDGTGLGLYMVKAIVEGAGGKVWFTSEEGKGSSFFFSIPDVGMMPKTGEVSLGKRMLASGGSG